MAWESRGNQRYFYRSKRVGDRVVKEYVGPGLAGSHFEALHEVRQAQKAVEREAIQADMDAVALLEAAFNPLDEFATAVAETALLAAGYHRPKRGPWRKRRATAESASQTDPADPPGLGGETGGAEGV
jgi:hypothetical protein